MLDECKQGVDGGNEWGTKGRKMVAWVDRVKWEVDVWNTAWTVGRWKLKKRR